MQFSMSDGGMREFDGRFPNRVTRHKASSISRSASIKVGYLRKKESLGVSMVQIRGNDIPLLNDVIQSVNRFILFQTFCTAPFASS